MWLDHVAVAGENRAVAQAYVEDRLGVPLQMGGEHPRYSTHNALLGLKDGLFVEAIAIDPDAPDPGRARWFGLDDFSGAPRMTNWICAVDDIEAVVAAVPDAGEIIPLERGDLRWRMAVPVGGTLPFDNLFPALMQWDGPHPGSRLQQQGVTLTGLKVSHPDGAELAALLEPWLRDDLISIGEGAPGLEATFATPSGPRTLT